jgi:hypothetical protein
MEIPARMLDLAFILLLTFCSAGAGLRLLRALGQTPDHPADALALGVPLGLGALALTALGLGEIGLLTVPALAGILAIGAALGGSDTLFAIQQCFMPRAGAPWPDDDPPSLLDHAFTAAAAVAVLGTLLTALAPVTDGDALCYHLEVPKRFLVAHKVFFDPDLHETIYPCVTELLYAVALAFRGPVACRLVHWALGLVFATNVTALARPILGRRAPWAGTIALLVPAVTNGMGAPLNDVSLAAFGNAVLVCRRRWLDETNTRTALTLGIFMGLALGVKYPALILVGLVSLGMFIGILEAIATYLRTGVSNVRARAKEYSVGLLATVLVGGWWYLRAWLATGNPVYPYFRETFGGAGIAEVLDPTRRAMPLTAWNLGTALVSMTLHPERFESFSHQLGPIFLLFLPALLFICPPGRVVFLFGVGMAFLTVCLTKRQSPRFVLTAVGPLAVAVAWVVQYWRERRSVPARLLLGMLVLVLGYESAIAVVRARHGISVVAGRETSEAYLTRREPTYRVARWVDAHLPTAARIVGQDHRAFYFPRPYTMELAHRRRTGLGTCGESAQEILDHLRAAGFTHLLLCPPVPETAVEFDPTLSRRLSPWLAEQDPLYRADIVDPDGVLRRYAIYALAESIEKSPVAQRRDRAGVSR